MSMTWCFANSPSNSTSGAICEAHAVSRVTLRKLLLAGPDDVVRFGKEFTEFTRADDGTVTAKFADGTTAIFRRREDPAAIIARLGDRVRALGLDPECLLADSRDDDYVLWAFITHRDSLPASFTSKAQDDPAVVRELLAERTAGWHPDLRRLLTASTPDTLYQTGVSVAEPLDQWETGNVTGPGDAVHHMPPVGGLGGNTALRDAHRLCAALTAADRGEEPLPQALRAYEMDMLRYGFETVREVVRNTESAITRSGLKRSMARWFFRTCGAVPPLVRAVFGER